MEHAYAEALWKMIQKGMNAKAAVHALHKVLAARGRTALFPRIAHAFARLAQRSASRTGMTLHIAHEGDERNARAAAKNALEEMHLSEYAIDAVVVDKTLVGGWRLEGAEQLVDASYKKQLLTIYHRATHA